MTLSPEARAKAVLDAMQAQVGICACIGPQAGADACPCALKRRALIAAAIRQAEETAVQRVLTAIESAHDHVATIAIMRIRENDPTLLKDTAQ